MRTPNQTHRLITLTKTSLAHTIKAAMLISACGMSVTSFAELIIEGEGYTPPATLQSRTTAPQVKQQTTKRATNNQLSISSLSGVQIDETRNTIIDGQVVESQTIDDDSPLSKQTTTATQPTQTARSSTSKAASSLNPDNISAEQLTRQDEEAERTDDISDGQAVASPDGRATDDSNDGVNYQLPNQQPTTERILDTTTINSIENKDGKTYTTLGLSGYAQKVNNAKWSPNMAVNTAMSIKLQALLDWNHASPGPIDGGWGMNSKKALINFQNMKGIPATGKMNQQTWSALTQNIPTNQPVLVTYTLTNADVNTNFASTPAGAQAKSKMKGLYYQDIKEMLAERFHMDVRYLDKLNKNKRYQVGETITVINTGSPLQETITRVVANKADKTLYAYNGNKLVATYPTTVGSSTTPSPHGTYKIVNKVKMPWYKATVGDGAGKQVYMLPPGPNNPVGVVWMGLSKPSYGLHGSPKPEGISRQASHGCIRLTNWDVLEVYANINKGATVELQ